MDLQRVRIRLLDGYSRGFFRGHLNLKKLEKGTNAMNNEVMVLTKAGEINCDFQSAKDFLNEQLKVYSGMVFTEDTKKEAKKVVADLRKQKKMFSDRISEVRADYMKPFEEFKENAYELIDLYDKPISFINGQIEIFEQNRIEEKKIHINELYEEMIADYRDELPLAKIYNKKWENATFTDKQIREEMLGVKTTVKEGLEAIKSMNSDIEEEAIRMFMNDFNLGNALTAITNREKQKKEILDAEQERIRKEEEERIRAEERRRIEEEIKHKEEIERIKAEAEIEKKKEIEEAVKNTEEEVLSCFVPEEDDSKTIEYEYHITLTDSEKEKLEMYMDSIGIEFEVMPVF